jgi:NAD(P)-dependent dehydrogenase (short-subunit alcohol dehydrogenase family)
LNDRSPIALISGAGSGIGRATARKFLSNGYRVILVGRTKGTLLETASESPSADVRVCDVTDVIAVTEVFKKVESDYGRLDVLFNNAGISSPTSLIDKISIDTWMDVLHTNITGSFLLAQAAFRLMRTQSPQGGRIINNGSISAQVPRPGSVPYTTTKHAITGLTKSLSLDGREFNICCGQIDIGNALTEMAVPMTRGVKQANGAIEKEPTMNVEHVADAVLHMANLPLEANVQFMTVMASKMPLIGRG